MCGSRLLDFRRSPPSNSSTPGGSKRRRPSRVSMEEKLQILGRGVTWRTSSLDTLFRRRNQWSPAQVQGSWTELTNSRDDSTVKGNKWKEKPHSSINIAMASSVEWPPSDPCESGGTRSLPSNYSMVRTSSAHGKFQTLCNCSNN